MFAGVLGRPLRNYYIGFGLLLQTAGLLVLNPAMAQVRIVDALTEQYPYEARDMQATDMLEDFSRYTDIPVRAGDVSGSLTVDNGTGTAAEFLDRIARETDSLWWSDGVAILFEPQNNVRRDVVASDGVSSQELTQMVDFIGLTTGRYAPTSSPDGEMFIITGPAGYVDAVRNVIGQISAANIEPEPVEPDIGLPQVYRGGPIIQTQPGGRTLPPSQQRQTQ